MTYELISEPVEINGEIIDKVNIVYSDGSPKEPYSKNGVVIHKVRDGYVNVNAPKWLNLEQTLRYSSLFEKAWTEASDKGFNLFTITLINGKSGVASEAALSFAFEMLGVTWDENEKEQLNQILKDNNFTIQLK